MVVSANLNHDPWARESKAHWQKHRPKMYNELEKSGQLEDTLRTAVQRAQDQCAANLDAGMDPFEAERQAKTDYLLLPDEEDVPLLGENPDSLPDPANLPVVAFSGPGPTLYRVEFDIVGPPASGPGPAFKYRRSRQIQNVISWSSHPADLLPVLLQNIYLAAGEDISILQVVAKDWSWSQALAGCLGPQA
jgi:hypothetical protein